MSRRGFFLAAVALMVAITANWSEAREAGGSFGRGEWMAEVVNRGLNPVDVVYPFDASPEMIAWAEDVMKATPRADPGGQLSHLQRAMFEGDSFDFSYDDVRTLTAKEAFAARRGNCMSFTALFVALSRSVGIWTFLMEVERDPEVNRRDGLVIINRHVVAGHRSGGQVSMFDFYLSSEASFLGGFVIDDVHASAMYHANLGGAALRNDDLGEALRHLEITTVLAPDWAAGWVNLGVTHAHRGDVEAAFTAYRRALGLDAGNSSALNNMSFLYSSLGREAEARVALRAAAERTESPFTLLAMADIEMDSGNNREAEKYLKRAKRWDPREPEVYDGLARLALRKDEGRKARRYRRKAGNLRARAAEERQAESSGDHPTKNG